jgi:hypothetical protein
MNTKQRNSLKKEALRLVNEWKEHLLLSEWAIEVVYPRKDLADQNMTVFATVSSDPVYLRAMIRFYPAWFKEPKDHREHIVVHELCHCLTQQAWDCLGKLQNGTLVTHLEAQETIERLTQRISYVAMKGRR